MATRQNFTPTQKRDAFKENADWLKKHRVTGVEIALPFEPKRQRGEIYYCENCLFCHTEKEFFDVDHLVPDRMFRDWDKHPEARFAVNMAILCKSNVTGDLGCNQSKQGNLAVPRFRGLAYTKRHLDMNCFPVHERPFDWC